MKAATAFLLAAAALGTPARAQEAVPVLAIPPLATPSDKQTSAGSTLSVAWQATQLIASDLRSTIDMMALPPDQNDFYSYPEVTAPTFSRWRAKGAKAVLTGFVDARPDGRLAVGCYVYDVEKGRELGRTGFVVAADDWRRAAHKCSGLAYQTLTGSPGIFDTRVAYVAKSGAGAAQVTRIAVMDSDGLNHSYATQGENLVLTPRLSPKGDRLAYVSYASGQPQVHVIDLGTGRDTIPFPTIGMSFAPRFSPVDDLFLMSATNGGNTDIYSSKLGSGGVQRLTTAPGIDTSPSFSPDGMKIAFESDRSGFQQIYTMNSDGSNQRRLSFGGGWYGSPVWSPDGKQIAFVRRGADGLRIGVMDADGRNERLLTTGPKDEEPNWAPSSRELIFQRTDAVGRSGLYRVSANGGDPRRVTTPQDAGDPDWSGARD
jgi:TolB protein